MKLFKRLLIAILISSSLIVVTPTLVPNLPTSNVVQATSIKISNTKKTLYVGNKYTLKIKGTKKKVKWTSSNKKVATVNSKGKVTAKKKGTATITAKVSGKKYKCKITVKSKKSTYKSQTKSSTVYITRTGSKYHSSGCSCLRRSKISISLKNAKARGYTACKRCRP